MIDNNQKKFNLLISLNLPSDQYVITGSGPLGIRNLREIGDIDLIVSEELWNILVQEHGITSHNGVEKITFPGNVVEAFHEGSFPPKKSNETISSVNERISNAEIIDGLPFDRIEYVLYYKEKNGRKKDENDIILIKKWLKQFFN